MNVYNKEKLPEDDQPKLLSNVHSARCIQVCIYFIQLNGDYVAHKMIVYCMQVEGYCVLMSSAKHELPFQIHNAAVPHPRVLWAYIFHTIRFGTLKSRFGEIVELLEQKCADLCQVPQSKEHKYKIF